MFLPHFVILIFKFNQIGTTIYVPLGYVLYKSYFLLTELILIYMDLRTHNDYFHMQNYVTGFYI